ncbi:MAG: hypothetical protein AAGF12_26785 [Myxococcota bacterium]
MTGFDASGAAVVSQVARTRFEEGEQLFLRMYLYASCQTRSCGGDETCDDGRCIPSRRTGAEYNSDPAPITPRPIDGDGDGGTEGGTDCDPSRCWTGCDVGPCDEITQLAAGGAHTCALSTEGRIYCWGYNDDGQIGNGAMGNSAPPTEITLPMAADEITAGLDHTCAVLMDSSIFCWGDNGDGQLGNPNLVDNLSPTMASGVGPDAEIEGIAAGGLHTCLVELIEPNGGIRSFSCTGSNEALQLGPMATEDRSSFGASVNLADIEAIAAGDQHTCIVIRSRIECWGESDSGRLGNNRSEAGIATPTPVLGPGGTAIENAVDIALGKTHTCFIDDATEVRCFGTGDKGELGAGTADALVAEVGPEATPGTFLAGFTELSAGVQQTCGIRNGEVWCWGASNDGALALGTVVTAQPPTQLDVPGTATRIAVGGGDDPLDGPNPVTHVCALVDGQVYCWGNSAQGQTGRETPLVDTPTLVPSP